MNFFSYQQVMVLKLPYHQNKRMQEIREGVKALHLDRGHGYTDVIRLLLCKEIERGTLRYQCDEPASIYSLKI